MELRDTPEEAAFRAELRAWLDDNLPEERRGWRGGEQRFGDAFGRGWSRKLFEAGYAGLTWPTEYGGAGAPYSFQAIFYEEMARAHAPAHVGVIGLGMAGPTIMAHGTDAQKEAHLSKILSAEEIWCQGFSEPDAGSDLAAARTRAERRGDLYIVNGQKVWSSFAHIADFCILVTQSDADAPRYQNLTYLIVDMHAPGVELRPLRYTNYRSLGTYERTGIPGPEGSAIKLRWSEQNQRMTKLGRELLGADGILDDGWWHHQQLRSRGNTIEAGTSEVLRNIVAERVLGLPRSR